MNSRSNLATLACIFMLTLTLLIQGCGSPTIRQTASDGEANTPSAVSLGTADADGLSTADLRPLGVQLDWSYHHPQKIDQAFSANGNLYIVSAAGKRSHHLIKIDGTTGLPTWTYPLQVQLEFAPSVFVYPTELQAENPDELFIVERGMVHCVDDQYGARNYRIPCNFPISTSVVPGIDNLIVGGYDFRIYGLSKKEKFVAWTYLTNGAISAAPVNFAGRSYVGSEDGSFYALKQGNGFSKGGSWSFETQQAIEAAATVVDDRIYFGSRDTKMYCLTDGGDEAYLNWQANLALPVFSSPVVSGNSLFVTLNDNRNSDAPVMALACLDTADGSEKWRQEGYSAILISNRNQVWVTEENRNLTALNVSDGSIRWAFDCPAAIAVLGYDKDSAVIVNGNGLVQSISNHR